MIMMTSMYSVKYPENFFILRGNHECASINRIYGFYDECKRRYNIKLWKTFTDCFNCLPIAAIIDEKIFTMHGGLSPDLQSMEQIRRVMRPTDVPDTGIKHLTLLMIRPFVRSVMVWSGQGHYWVEREWSWCLVYIWTRRGNPIFAKTRSGPDMSCASGRGRRIRIFRQAPVGHSVFCAKLLWWIW